ncbi:MAG: hypothetical protein HYX40_11720 [Sphingobacteriales bacterium]|nr:hypothetical protein [Sphingobacteriales bacterium]
MEEKRFSPTESLSLIESMIKQAKSAERNNGLGWILWGWLLFGTSVGYYMAILAKWPYRGYIWPAFGMAAIALMLYTFLGRAIIKHNAPVKTYTSQLLGKLTLAFFISLMIFTYGNYATGVDRNGLNFGYLLVLYAIWMFIFAAAFQFKWFYWGAAFNWLGAIIIFYYKEKLGAEILLVHAACVALGYLIPGHIAYYQFNKTTAEKK